LVEKPPHINGALRDQGFFLFIERNAYPLEDWKVEFLMIHGTDGNTGIADRDFQVIGEILPLLPVPLPVVSSIVSS